MVRIGESRLTYKWDIKPLFGIYDEFFRYPTLWVLWFICLRFKTYDNCGRSFTKNLLYQIVDLLHGRLETGVQCILSGLDDIKIR